MDKNSKINLSSIRDEKWIIEKHFIDSIMLSAFFDVKWKVLDLWTGWGFPWIPLAIINPEAHFTLMDSIWKKIKVIDEFIKELKLKNIDTINIRAEELWQDEKHREKYDLVVSRATAFFPTLLEYTLPLLKPSWIFIAYKLEDREELNSWKKALVRLWWKIIKVKNYEIWWQKRVFVFVEKIKTTHPKYPRNIWEPLKSPII
jgi:16S rRNA (guanine527-N7)-methyltransferase